MVKYSTQERVAYKPRISEEQAIQLARSTDEHERNEGFKHLHTTYAPRLRNFIARSIRDQDRADDLVQETFMRMARHIQSYDTTKKFSTWAYTIASNLAKNEIRNQGRNPLVFFNSYFQGEKYGEDRASIGPQPNLTREQKAAVLEGEIAQINPTYREAVRLREIEGRSYEQIAEELNVNLGTVKSRINRGRSELAQHKERIKRTLDNIVLAR